jgi:hypothetical protein
MEQTPLLSQLAINPGELKESSQLFSQGAEAVAAA